MPNAQQLLQRLPRSVCLLVGLAAALAHPTLADSYLRILDGDPAGEGLTDPRPFTPIGGNDATTLGDARRSAIEFVARLWAQSLETSVPIVVSVTFDPLPGDATGAVLGRGGPAALYRDFAGAPRALTWYPSALGDKLAGLDLSGGADPDIDLLFNDRLDRGEVLGGRAFYYGFDHQAPPDQVSFIAVVAHELAHGLGFATQVDPATGAKFLGRDDAFMVWLRHRGATPSDFPQMSNTQRRTAAQAGPSLVWWGASVVARASGLAGGVSPEGWVQMYAPAPVSLSALSHFDLALSPDDLIEPVYSPAARVDFCLIRAALADLGWGAATECRLDVVLNPGGGGGENQPPFVSWLTPPPPTAVVGIEQILEAQASDSDGQVVKVEFLVNGQVAATRTQSPYTFTWTPTALGTFDLAIRATDNAGAMTTSPPTAVRMVPDLSEHLVFRDGFESGSTGAWSTVEGLTP